MHTLLQRNSLTGNPLPRYFADNAQFPYLFNVYVQHFIIFTFMDVEYILGDKEKNIKLAKKISSHLICPLCHRLLKDPIQTVRGELACQKCYQKHLG